MIKFRSKIDEIMQELDSQGKISVVSEEDAETLRSSIHEEMETYRYELHRKLAQSEHDIKTVIVT